MTTATETARDRYRENRRKYHGVSARTAWQWATAEPPPALDWEEYGRGLESGYKVELERDGFNVTIKALYDYDHEPFETFTDTESDFTVQTPEWDAFMARTEGRGDDLNYGYRAPDKYRYVELGFSYAETVAYYRNAGCSRGVADFQAREDIRKARDNAVREDRSVFWFKVSAYRAGVELGTASFGGYEIDPDASYTDTLNELSSAVHESDLVAEAIAEARETLETLCEGVTQS
jgi:hypothetical protein